MTTHPTFDNYLAQLEEFIPAGSLNALRSEAFVYFTRGLSIPHAANWLVAHNGGWFLEYEIPGWLLLLLVNLQTKRSDGRKA